MNKIYNVEGKNLNGWYSIAQIKKDFFPMAANGDLAIFAIEHDTDDYIFVGFNNDKKSMTRVKLNYLNGNTSFRKNGLTYNLDKFIRI